MNPSAPTSAPATGAPSGGSSINPAAFTAALQAAGYKTTPTPTGGASSGDWFSQIKPPATTPAPGLGQGAAGDFAGNAVRAVVDPLLNLGGTIEGTLAKGAEALGAKVSPQVSGQGALDTAAALEKSAPNNLAGDMGTIVGTIAPYFFGSGEAEAGANLAAKVPEIASKLGMSADSLVLRVASYLASVAPEAAKNFLIGTTQTGSPKQGAEIAGAGALAEPVVAGAGALAEPVVAGVGKLAGASGKLASQVMGFETGTGASSVRAAFDAGKTGSDAFSQALRGTTQPTDILQSAEDAVSKIVNSRRSQYLSDLANVKADITSKDISPVLNELDTQLKNFGINVGNDGKLDFSRSSISEGPDANKIQQAYDTIKSWGSKAGDRTAVGLDTLKQRLGNLFNARVDGRPVSAFLTPLKQSVRDVLSQVPGYDQMSQNYSKASDLLDEIRSATGIGGTSKPDTVLTKLQTALKGDKDFRLQALQSMMNASGVQDLEQKIAGLNMSSFTPKGLVGQGEGAGILIGGMLGHVFNPSSIPLLLSTSPRLVGEFVHGLGVASKYTEPIVNLLERAGSNPDIAAGVMSTLQGDQTPSPATTPPAQTQ